MKHICDYGCNKEGIYQIGSKWCCSPSFNSCESKKSRRIKPREKPEFCDYGCGQEPKYYLKNRKWCCSKSQNSCPSKKERSRYNRVGKPNKPAQPIETNELCSFGCGQIANYIYQNGSFCCSYDWHKCPGKHEQITNTVAKIWSDPERRKKLSESQRKNLIAVAIPILTNDKFCYYCGEKANFWFKTNDKYCCSDRIERCVYVRKQISKRLKKQWKDTKFVKKVQQSLNSKPNGPEKILLTIFQNLNLNYRFTGDFSFMIDGKNPDFTNEKEKKVIDFFGDWWHGEKFLGIPKEEHEEERINHFEKNGYKCLVIWEEELKNINNVINKIISFSI